MLASAQSTQKDDSEKILLFSLEIQPLVRRIAEETNIVLIQGYTDHGTLMDPLEGLRGELRLLCSEIPA